MAEPQMNLTCHLLGMIPGHELNSISYKDVKSQVGKVMTL